MEKKIHTIATLETNSFSAHLDEVILRDGNVGKRIRIRHPEAAAIIPFLSETDILMVRQFRYAFGRETLEIPAGKIGRGERPDACARRELMEETGHSPGAIELLYSYAPAIGYSDEIIHIFIARELTRLGTGIDEREITSLETIPIRDVKEMIKKGLIQDGKTLLAVLMMDFLGTEPA
ncbi:MAG: NUDIX hydrolase [Deltaproteobacteria bacterium]|nr:NUDIX hydrolase [Deltaproteobacteria bacterium]MBW2138414.1 NUDIX hydrolase [Deltaproteobacteria bacterium]